MIESIYADVWGDRPNTSRYTLLIEKLAAAERAKNVHEAMTRRVLKAHDRRIAETRAELEAESERLRKLVKVAKT